MSNFVSKTLNSEGMAMNLPAVAVFPELFAVLLRFPSLQGNRDALRLPVLRVRLLRQLQSGRPMGRAEPRRRGCPQEDGAGVPRPRRRAL